MRYALIDCFQFWQYEENGVYKNYDADASDTVEDVYQGYLANRGDTDGELQL